MSVTLPPATLLKAIAEQAQRAEGEEPEAWMAPIEDRLYACGLEARHDLGGDVVALLRDLRKADGGPRLSLAEIDELRLLVRQHYLCRVAPEVRAAFWAGVPGKTRARWERLGIAGPGTVASGQAAIDDAVIAARVAEIIETGASYRTMRQLAQERPQTRVQELARQVAREHCGAALYRLGARHGDLLADLAADERRRELGRLMEQFLAGQLPGVRGTQALATVLRARLGQGDIARDWRRVAVSETRYAFNYATFLHYHETGVEQVYYVVQPNACDHCKRLLLYPDGQPRRFALHELIADLAANGGTNRGRSAALIGRPGGWLPTALLHPWCRCRPLPYRAGLPPVPTGDRRQVARSARKVQDYIGQTAR